MDEEEIDGWYEEEKQKCMDEYLDDLGAAKNHEEAEKKYENKLNKIMARYNELMEEKLQNTKSSKLRDFISEIKTKLSSLK